MPDVDPAADRSDLAALRRGEDDALDRLVARWRLPLGGFAYRYLRNAADAEDALAETFVRLYRHRGRLRPDSNVSAWLFTTLANLCRNRLRWRERHPAAELDPHSFGAASGGGLFAREEAPDAALSREELSQAVAAAVDALPHPLRSALLLHQYAGLSYREIAAVLGCGERGVDSRLCRARAILRRRLSAWWDPPAGG